MSQSRPPSFQLYPAPWFADTRLMTRDERCRYMEALMHSWLEESYGVATEDQWRRWLGYTAKVWERERSRFAPRFQIEGDVWTQKRLFEVRCEQLVNHSKAASGGVARKKALSEVARSLSAQIAANKRWHAC